MSDGAEGWVKEVNKLYCGHPEMDVEEYEALLDVAFTGHRPDHPDLPVFLPFATEVVYE